MKPPNESPLKNPEKTEGTPKQKPAIEPPTQPFIVLDTDGPGDPSKFHRFIVPKEFLDKANAVELPRVNPDDFVDDSEPPSQSKPKVAAPGNTTETKPAAPSPSQSETLVTPRRRKSAPIPKDLLSGATPAVGRSVLKSKPVWILGGVIIVLALLFVYLSGKDDSGGINGSSVATASAPLLPLPVQEPLSASKLTTKQSQPLPSAETPTANGTPSASASEKKNVPSKPKQPSSKVEHTAPTAQPKSTHPQQATSPTTAPSSPPGKNPWFIQDN